MLYCFLIPQVFRLQNSDYRWYCIQMWILNILEKELVSNGSECLYLYKHLKEGFKNLF